ncbi:MAG: hypothetical protein ACWA49_03965 [Ruegeria sp.]
MTRFKLSELERITSVAFEREFRKLRPVLQEEARVQNRLSDLDAQVKRIESDAADTEGYQISGADVAWRAWESTTRKLLNVEMAQIQSRKLERMDELRAAFGRKTAVETLCRNNETKARQNRCKTLLSRLGQ